MKFKLIALSLLFCNLAFSASSSYVDDSFLEKNNALILKLEKEYQAAIDARTSLSEAASNEDWLSAVEKEYTTKEALSAARNAEKDFKNSKEEKEKLIEAEETKKERAQHVRDSAGGLVPLRVDFDETKATGGIAVIKIEEIVSREKALTVLGFDKDANPSFKDVEKAFKALALKFHPDKSPKTEVEFQKINKARDILTEGFLKKTIKLESEEFSFALHKFNEEYLKSCLKKYPVEDIREALHLLFFNQDDEGMRQAAYNTRKRFVELAHLYDLNPDDIELQKIASAYYYIQSNQDGVQDFLQGRGDRQCSLMSSTRPDQLEQDFSRLSLATRQAPGGMGMMPYASQAVIAAMQYRQMMMMYQQQEMMAALARMGGGMPYGAGAAGVGGAGMPYGYGMAGSAGTMMPYGAGAAGTGASGFSPFSGYNPYGYGGIPPQ